MSIENFIQNSLSDIDLIAGHDGEVVYSAESTLGKGDFYYLGLNPGGAGHVKVGEHLRRFNGRKENAFFDEVWSNRNGHPAQGGATLQRRVQCLFDDFFKCGTRNVFATNLIFKTTPSAATLNYGLAGYCWRVHERALKIVHPKVIISCGNGSSGSAFSFISDIYDGKCHEEKFGNFSMKTTTVKIFGENVLVLGFPHLSRFDPMANDDFKKYLTDVAGHLRKPSVGGVIP